MKLFETVCAVFTGLWLITITIMLCALSKMCFMYLTTGSI